MSINAMVKEMAAAGYLNKSKNIAILSYSFICESTIKLLYEKFKKEFEKA